MAIQTTYSRARAQLARLLDRVVDDRETVLIDRRGRERVAMIAESELSSLLETAHLLRSPQNAERLLTALTRARTRKTRRMTIEELVREVGIGKEAP